MSLSQRKDVRGNGAGGPGAQRAVGDRSAGAAGGAAPSAPADPELVERPQRRRFSAEYKPVSYTHLTLPTIYSV